MFYKIWPQNINTEWIHSTKFRAFRFGNDMKYRYTQNVMSCAAFWLIWLFDTLNNLWTLQEHHTCVSAFVEILESRQCKSSRKLLSDNIQWYLVISFPSARFLNLILLGYNLTTTWLQLDHKTEKNTLMCVIYCFEKYYL